MEVSVRTNAGVAHTLPPLTSAAASVRPELDAVVARIAQQVVAFDPAVEAYASYAIDSSGKLLRPLTTLLAGGATGGISDSHLDLAVIIELIHLASLVHDDIIDEAERRRGLPTLNARWGNAISVLLGDALFAHALDLSTGFESSAISRAIARATRDVCSGEIIQTQRRFDLHLAIDEYFRIIELKTATLFATGAQLAAELNGASEEHVHCVARFGRRIGIAYQIYDDCIDLTGREETTGKTLGTDLRKGKLTLPLLRLLREAPPRERERCHQLILEGDAAAIARLLQSSGAMETSLAAGIEHVQQAHAELQHLAPSRSLEALYSLAESIGALLLSVRTIVD